MTAQDLKNSILQLAMQGKLVPQDPNDEPASELLKRIKAEKVRLIKEGKIRKEKSQPAISKDEIPFDIPESWAWVRLGSAFSTVMGQSPEGSSVTEIEEGIEFHQGKIFFTDEIIAPSPQRTSKPTKIAPSGSILLCVRAPVGKVNITNRNICIGRGLAAIVTNGGILKKFTYYMLQTLETVFNQKANGSTFKAISSAIISNQVVPIPPISEQERIVEKIEELLPLIERYDESEKRLLELNKKFPDELRKSILQQAVQGKLTEQDPHDEPASELLKRIKAEKVRLIKEGKIKKEKPLPPISEEEILFDIPESWEWSTINELFFVTKLAGFEYTKHFTKENILQSNPVPLVRAQNVRMNGFLENEQEAISMELSNLLHRSSLYKDCLLMTFIGAGIGDTCIYSSKLRHHLAPNVAKMEPFVDGIDLQYALIWLMSPAGQKNVEKIKKSTAQPSLSMGTIRSIKIAVPPLSEQKRIVARVEEILPLSESLK